MKGMQDYHCEEYAHCFRCRFSTNPCGYRLKVVFAYRDRGRVLSAFNSIKLEENRR